jgi:hypothetical protein
MFNGIVNLLPLLPNFNFNIDCGELGIGLLLETKHERIEWYLFQVFSSEIQ